MVVRLIVRSVFISILVVSGSTHADVSSGNTKVAIQSVFQRMGQAMRSISYAGDVVYEHGGMLETMRVTHKVGQGVRKHSLEHLSGPQRQFEESEKPVVCESVGNYLLRGGMIASSRQSALNIEQSYRFIPLGTERIASREAEMIEILPRDKHRYGMVLGIDKETGLPLKLLVSSIRDRRIIERMQYVSLDLFEDKEAKGQTHVEQNPTSLSTEPNISEQIEKVNCSRSTGDSPWQPAWLPIGFVKTHYKNSPDQGHTETYTDGLATFSIFIAAVEGANVLLPQGVANRGATSMLLSSVKSQGAVYRISVVGEIPADTARKVALSMQTIGGMN